MKTIKSLIPFAGVLLSSVMVVWFAAITVSFIMRQKILERVLNLIRKPFEKIKPVDRNLLHKSNRLMRVRDPVYLELFTGMITLFFGIVLFSVDTDPLAAQGLPSTTDTFILLALAPKWVWGSILVFFGTLQMMSTFYDLPIFSTFSSSWLSGIWGVITAYIIYGGGMKVRPLASIVSPLMTIFQFCIFIWQTLIRRDTE